MQFTAEELANVFDSTTLGRARRYVREGRVTGLARDDASGLVTARVRGQRKRPYRVSIRLARDENGSLEVSGECTCPVRHNCKHVAATLLKACGAVQEKGRNRAEAVAAETPSPPGTHKKTRPPALPPSVRHWLEAVEQATLPETYPPKVHDRIVYVVDLHAEGSGAPRLGLTLFKTRQRRDGSYTHGLRMKASASARGRFVLPTDAEIMRLLVAAGGSHSEYTLSGETGAQLLKLLASTGRAFLHRIAPPALALCLPRRAQWVWRLTPEGLSRLTLEPERVGGNGHEIAILPVAPPWFLDLSNGHCGPLETGLPELIAGALAASPALDADSLALLLPRLKSLVPSLPSPPEVRLTRVEGVKPVPHLTLTEVEDRHGRIEVGVLRLAYDGVLADPADDSETLRAVADNEVRIVVRDRDAEIAAIGRLIGLGLSPVPPKGAIPSGALVAVEGSEGWARFILQGVEKLRAEGWVIEFASDFRFRVLEVEGWTTEVEEQGNDWFDLGVAIQVGGTQVELLPLLVRLLQDKPELFETDARAAGHAPAPEQHVIVALDDGRLIRLPLSRIRPIVATLVELFDPESIDKQGRVRLPRLASPALLGLATGPWSGGERLRELAERLRNFSGIEPAPLPAGFRASLRPYQHEGLSWLQFLRAFDLGGILADDMGLGKTVQTLAHLLLEKESGRMDRPSLVVAPTSLVHNWRREANQFAPQLSVLVLQGEERKTRFEAIPEHDVVLTTYPLLARDEEVLKRHQYHLLILDEAQNIKNPRVRAAEIVRELSARHRLCLTGTPMENHLGELWSLFHFVMPGFLGDEARFKRLYRIPIEKHGNEARRQTLQARIRPFLLRRTKEEVAKELPPKTEIVRTVALEGAQRDLYETVRAAMHERVRLEVAAKGLDKSRIVILDALLKLRQICCDPRLLKMEAAQQVQQSAKLELLMAMLPEMVEEGRRILVFSQFTTMLGLIEDELKARELGFVKLTGETKDRASVIDRFQAGEVPIFLISLKAGGTGLNLTAADTVIHYDPWWNPAVEAQATDRAYRIGQDKPVFVYKLITEHTVEEKIAQMQAQKHELAEALLGEGKPGTSLRPEDLSELFAPLGD